MKRVGQSIICAVLAFVMVFGLDGLCAKTVLAADTSSLPAVNKAKGVTYVRNDKDQIVGLNLNGNSVIMENVEKPTGSTSTDEFFKVYIDANSNGKVDSGETAVSLENPAGGQQVTLTSSLWDTRYTASIRRRRLRTS